MAVPEPPPQLDPKVLRSMTNLIVNAVQVHRLSLEEACGRAWGYAHAYHAWLPAETIDAAIRHCCAQLQPPTPRRFRITIDGRELHAVDGQDLQTVIGEALAWEHHEEPLRSALRDITTTLAAENLTARLRRGGHVFATPALPTEVRLEQR